MRKQAEIEVANKLIDLMENAGSNWVKPWSAAATAQGMRNAKSNRPYRGVNVFLTSIAAAANGWSSPYWNTYKGWAAMGHQVARGSTGTEIVFWKMLGIKDKASGKDKMVPFARLYNVFNGDQLTEPYIKENAPVSEFEPHEAAQSILDNSGAVIVEADRAYYTPSLDTIALPPKDAFHNIGGYYGTGFHELGHWTGAETRCNRNLTGRFGDPDYAFEELIAEITSALLCVHSGVTPEPREDHAKYINCWIKGLKDDPKVIWRAFSAAQKATDFVLADDDVENEEMEA